MTVSGKGSPGKGLVENSVGESNSLAYSYLINHPKWGRRHGGKDTVVFSLFFFKSFFFNCSIVNLQCCFGCTAK